MMDMPLPEPFRRQGQQMSNDGNDKVFFDCFTADQIRARDAEWQARIEKAVRAETERCIRVCHRFTPVPDKYSDMAEYTEARVAREIAASIKRGI